MSLVTAQPRLTSPYQGRIYEQITRELSLIIDCMRDLHDREGNGGCWCIADGTTGVPILMGCVGTMDASKVHKYIAFAAEKALRLAAHPEHVSSFQSRNEAEDQWPGAIRAGDTILSFSGLPWKLDEASMLILGQRIELLSREQAADIALISDNTALNELQLLFG